MKAGDKIIKEDIVLVAEYQKPNLICAVAFISNKFVYTLKRIINN